MYEHGNVCSVKENMGLDIVEVPNGVIQRDLIVEAAGAKCEKYATVSARRL